MGIIWKTENTVDIDSKTMAEIFCEMDSEQQAKFFVHCAEYMGRWLNKWEDQVYHIGTALKRNDFDSDARQLIKDLYDNTVDK